MSIRQGLLAMATPARVIVLSIAAICSVILIGTELIRGQIAVRAFFADIATHPGLWGTNTTISVSLFFATAFGFLVCLMTTYYLPPRPRERAFYASQIVVFVYLGIDDRFFFHEWLGARYGFENALVILAVGLIEVACLWRLGNIRERSPQVRMLITAAALFAASKIFFDVIFPPRTPPRKSLEHLSKTWSTICLVFYAMEMHREQLVALVRRSKESDAGPTASSAMPETTTRTPG